MLQLTILGQEYFDEDTQEFITIKPQTLMLEHSLVSISKWESKWEKSFISGGDKTDDELVDYIRCMTINQNVDPNVYRALTNEHIRKVNDYINAKMTATWFYEEPTTGGAPKRETITSELIYYWMIAQNIPMECQKWHLNRLLTLIKVCSIKNTPPKKMSKNEINSRNAKLNAARKAAMHTHG